MVEKWTGRIEYWPHNGIAKHVMRFKGERGQDLCFARLTRESAEREIDGAAYCMGEQWGDTCEVLRP